VEAQMDISNTTRLACLASVALVGAAAHSATVYVDGTTAALSTYAPGTFDLGAFLPNYIGPTQNEGNGTALDGTRVFIYDINDAAGPNGPAGQASFNLLAWHFTAPKDSVRLYTHQDHYSGGAVNDTFTAAELLEYSVWGCNSGGVADYCKVQAHWSYLADPTSFVLTPSGPVYSYAGTEAATVFRGGSAEFGIVNAFTQDYTFAGAYDFYAIRGSTIAMQANTADPELDAMVAFNRVDVPVVPGVPEPSTYALTLAGLGLLAYVNRRRKGTTA
jgi:PEP-CTERM motif